MNDLFGFYFLLFHQLQILLENHKKKKKKCEKNVMSSFSCYLILTSGKKNQTPSTSLHFRIVIKHVSTFILFLGTFCMS